jgi:hypothetical protein
MPFDISRNRLLNFAVPCRAVPCRAVPCRAVPCRAVRRALPRNLEGSIAEPLWLR